MVTILSKIAQIVGQLAWGPWTVSVIMLIGLYLTVGSGAFQLRHIPLWMHHTAGSLFSSRREKKEGISPFQSVTVALAGTMGTGNIAGVAAAVTAGGAGAIFWMWVSALIGMIIDYSEIVLGMLYRKRGEKGQWQGGPMNYIRHALKSPAAAFFAFVCMLASFGMGNVVQVNSVAQVMHGSFSVPGIVTGIAIAALLALVIIGGIKRVASITERLVPLVTIVYTLAAVTVIIVNAERIPAAFEAIFADAFSMRAGAGGILGTAAIGIKRGIFTNEAGLGASVMAHTCADTDSAVKQGMWGVFEVFTDTIVMCTLTALVILTAPQDGLQGLDGALLSARAFASVFGRFGDILVALSLALLAFATLVAWSCYGEQCFVWLFGSSCIIIYRIVFVALAVLGSVSEMSIAWDISDALNALMAFPNLAAVVLLSPQIFSETRQFLAQEKKHGAKKKLFAPLKNADVRE